MHRIALFSFRETKFEKDNIDTTCAREMQRELQTRERLPAHGGSRTWTHCRARCRELGHVAPACNARQRQKSKPRTEAAMIVDIYGLRCDAQGIFAVTRFGLCNGRHGDWYICGPQKAWAGFNRVYMCWTATGYISTFALGSGSQRSPHNVRQPKTQFGKRPLREQIR